ncbi:MAG: SDR family oxidoreductase [Acidobacteriaceae bacterium]|nr:SDR family oxidoreductase [Acidobacteriaceae bacterium]
MGREMNGQSVLVTGAANGIGFEIARRFAEEGSRVFSVDIEERGDTPGTFLRADVAIAEDVERAFQAAGAIDILVNNAAAWAGDGYLHEVTETVWDRVLAVSLKGVYLCSKAVLPSMMTRRSGVIINISSVNALTGLHLAAYTAAKGGVVSLTRLMARQYGQFGIRTNVICPGTILSASSEEYYREHPEMGEELANMYPAKAFGKPEDIAECVLYLASGKAHFLNGAVIPVDGGMSAVHRLASLDIGDAL